MEFFLNKTKLRLIDSVTGQSSCSNIGMEASVCNLPYFQDIELSGKRGVECIAP